MTATGSLTGARRPGSSVRYVIGSETLAAPGNRRDPPIPVARTAIIGRLKSTEGEGRGDGGAARCVSRHRGPRLQ